MEMTTAQLPAPRLTDADSVVLAYLADLWSHSEGLTPRLRDDLMATVARYITARRPAVSDPAEVVRWLGPPEVLVAAIRRGQAPH
jgi:sarcosine oxidase gamma subunit